MAARKKAKAKAKVKRGKAPVRRAAAAKKAARLKKRAAPARRKAASKKAAARKPAAKKVPARRAAAKQAPARRAAVKKGAGKPRVAPQVRAQAKTAPTRRKQERPAASKPRAPAAAATPAAGTHDERIGSVTHYYNHLSVAVVRLESGTLRVGDRIRVAGHTTDFTQPVESLQVDHGDVEEVGAGQEFGLKVIDHAREHDAVYKVAS